MPSRSARASAESTSASSEPAGPSSPSASDAPTGEACSPGTGRQSRALRTFEKSHRGALENDSDKWTENPRRADDTDSRQLICSQEEPPARISASQEGEPASLMATGPACSSSSPGSPMTLFGQQDGCCLRTYPDSFPQTPAEISPSFSRRWPTSGFTTSPGECWTAATSECPNDGDASSSLPDVLLETVPERFYLSPRAAAGILRRAQKRGRTLPQPLHQALTDLASAHEDDDSTMTRTSSEPSANDTERAPTPTATISSPIPSDPRASTPAKTERAEAHRSSRAPSDPTSAPAPTPAPTSSVRRLTPTECERLQGFPDGWSILNPTDPATPPVEMP